MAELFSVTVGPGEVESFVPADFRAMRGTAVEAYQELENSLFDLFRVVTGMNIDIAAIVFFKITSTKVRNSILDKLIRKKFGSKYSLFWNSYLKELRMVDSRRNEIVHWTVAEVTTGEPAISIGVHLIPPTFWDIQSEKPRLSKTDIGDFVDKCAVFSRACKLFITAATSPLPVAHYQAWLERFQKPLVYPPPADDLLHTTAAMTGLLRRSSHQ